jgi:methylmalonyl-CoA mutase N-terminal domain/subunit
LKDVKKNRDQGKVRTSLEALRQAVKGEENLMPRFVEAVKAYSTIREICGDLREVFGEYRQDQSIR